MKGRTFLVTRTITGNLTEKRELEQLGANVLELPVIEIAPPTSSEKIEGAVERVEDFDWIVFTSSKGVRSFFVKMRQKEKPKDKIRAKFACVGSETAKALEEEGFQASIVPKEFLTTTLGEEMSSKFSMKDQKVLLARAEEASPEIADILRHSGATVVEAPAYRTVLKKMRNLNQGILNGVTDVTLTSPSAVRGLLLNFDARELNSRGIRVHCIGPITSESAIRAGLKISSISTVHNVSGMIDTIVRSRG